MPQAVDAQQLSQKVGPSASLIIHELPAWNAMEPVPPGLFWQVEFRFGYSSTLPQTPELKK